MRGDAGRSHARRSAPDDSPASALKATAGDEPLFGAQWYLGSAQGYDISIDAVWGDYTGAGVVVAVMDTGIDLDHPDLDANIDPLHQINSKTGASGPGTGAPVGSGDNHGTTVAGVIAAEDNGIGVVGIAYQATLVPLYTPLTTASFALAGFQYALAIGADIVNNSWGYGGQRDPFYIDFDDPVKRSGEDASFAAYGNAIRDLAEDGRDGLGTIVVFSAGNHRGIGDDVNLSNFTNSRYTITVAATEESGDIASFSTPGAAILVAAPGVAIATTDRDGNQGYVPNTYPASLGSNDYVVIDGTSFSAPIVSGVTALMLEANPGLGARDVQEILAVSARTLQPEATSWQTNGATTWNGGGMTWSTDYGSGLVDAHAAVRLAETWFTDSLFGAATGVAGTFNNEATATGSQIVNVAVPDNDGTGVTSTITLGGDITIDHVEVHLVVAHDNVGDLVVELVSPSGTSARLVDNPYLGSATDNNIDFTLDSTFFWGEQSTGDWTLRVADTEGSIAGTFVSWELTAYGDATAGDDTYIFTDEYGGTFAVDDAARRTLSDSSGHDTLNLAAMTAGSTVNLATGNGTLAGRALTISESTTIEDVIGGDGSDVLIGDAAANRLYGGRSNDTLIGEGGDDTLNGSHGADVLWGGEDDDLLLGGEGDDTLDGGTGNDALDGGAGDDTVRFGTAYGLGRVSVDLSQTGAQTVNGAGDTVRLTSVENAIGSASADTLVGDGGANVLHGKGGRDGLRGGGGDDELRGGSGRDLLIGESGDDVLWGDNHGDVLRGGSGNDRLFGGNHDDQLYGDTGNDTLIGSHDADVLWGGEDDDLLLGGEGNDTLDGGAGNDILDGGAGRDRFVFATGDGIDRVQDFTSGEDTLDLMLVTEIPDFATLMASHATEVDGSLVIRYGIGNSITLVGVTNDQLGIDDVLF